MPVTPLIRGRGPRLRDASGGGHPRPDDATTEVPADAARRRDRPRAPRWTRSRTAVMPVPPTHCRRAGFRAWPKRDDATGGRPGGGPPSCRQPCSPQNPPGSPTKRRRPRAGPWSSRGRRGDACLPWTRDGEPRGIPRSAADVRQSAARCASTGCDQADSAPRPLRRRAARMARPARVRMRRRNPWTFARRRLFGWKVRLPLLTASPVCRVGREDWGPSVWRVVRAHGSLWCLLPTCGLVTTSDDNVGARNTPVAYGRPYEGTHPGRTAGKRPLGHGPRPADGPGLVDTAAPNGNPQCTVKCWLSRMPCGHGRGLLACLSRVTGRGARVSGWWSAHRRTTSPQVASPRVAVH
jgi:hypothetical protein